MKCEQEQDLNFCENVYENEETTTETLSCHNCSFISFSCVENESSIILLLRTIVIIVPRMISITFYETAVVLL